jgi:CRP-like cAMP-binding protein
MNLFEQTAMHTSTPVSPCPDQQDRRRTARVPRRMFSVREQVVLRGAERFETHIVISGMLGRYSLTSDGQRQFTGLLLPGDVIGLEALFNLRIPDNAVARCATVAQPVSPADLEEPALRQLLWEALERQTALAGEWMLNLGARPALQRLAYFFHETMTRMRALGIGHRGHQQLPLTQVELADFLALTPVHVNRCLGILRASGLATFYRGRLLVSDPARLARFAAAKEALDS